jgi:hypothetical protein
MSTKLCLQHINKYIPAKCILRWTDRTSSFSFLISSSNSDTYSDVNIKQMCPIVQQVHLD